MGQPSNPPPTTPMESESEGKGVLLHNDVLLGLRTGSCGVAGAEVVPVRTAEEPRYHYCFVNVGRVVVAAAAVGVRLRKKETEKGAWVCVSTCYITESGGRECCLACHTTAALQWE